MNAFVSLTCPLEMHQIWCLHFQISRKEIVFHSRISLYNVAPLAPHLYVEQSLVPYCGGTFLQIEHVWSILECTPVLRGVNSQSHRNIPGTNVNCWVLFDWRFDSISTEKQNKKKKRKFCYYFSVDYRREVIKCTLKKSTKK